MEINADSAPDPAHYCDADPDANPDFYFMRFRIRVQFFYLMRTRIHLLQVIVVRYLNGWILLLINHLFWCSVPVRLREFREPRGEGGGAAHVCQRSRRLRQPRKADTIVHTYTYSSYHDKIMTRPCGTCVDLGLESSVSDPYSVDPDPDLDPDPAF